MKIKLIQGTWLKLEDIDCAPGEIADVSDDVGAQLIAGGSATIECEEVITNANVNT